MVWLIFATKPERADTLEEANLNIGAPALYSADKKNLSENDKIVARL